MPWEAFAAIVLWLATVKQQRQLALCLLVAYHAYLRPIDLFSLRVHQVVRPVRRSRSARSWSLVLHPQEAGVPSKTGAFDESLFPGDCEKPLSLVLNQWTAGIRRSFSS